MKDCTTCKYGYEDEQLGIPMCHHPKRFSEDCVDFNMHEEKEIKESENPVPKDLEEAAEEYLDKLFGKGKHQPFYKELFIAGAKWQKEQDLAKIAQSKSPLSVAYANRCFENGKQAMKDQLMKDAVEGEVHKFGEVAYVKERNNAELTKYLSQFNNGDKVKIIVIHETDIR